MKATIACTLFYSLGTAVFANETAQENAPVHELPEFVVTATLWETDLLRTTNSTTAIDSSDLESNGSLHFQDLIEVIPNLTWTGGTSRPRYFQIRGIGENSQFEGETPDSTVRFLVDDLDFTGLGSIGNLFDMQQVEVLRGPQAGAFGVNAAGGLIKLVSNDPTPYWSGQAEGTIGQDNLRGGGFAFGGPVLKHNPESLTFRYSLYQQNSDGFRKNKHLNRDDTNERDEFNTRLKLSWKPASDWTWDGTLFYADANNGYDEWSLDNTGFTVFSDQPGRDEQESKAASIRGTWDGLPDAKLSTISTYTATDSLYSYDGDWSNQATAGWSAFVFLLRERERWSEEIRLDSAKREDALGLIDRWTLGLYFENLEEDSQFGGDWGNFKTKYESKATSIYGQATHLLSEKSKLTLGLRAEYFNLDTDIESREDVRFNKLLYGGKLTFEHMLNENQTLFASLGRGYKAGGANIYPYLDASLPVKYDSETLWNYEFGLRAKSEDGKLVSQLTLFYLDRENAQLRDSAGDRVSFTYFTTNGEGARHLGLEGETTWYFLPNWSFKGSLGLLDAHRDAYTDPSNAALTIEARGLANIPTYTYSARLAYNPNTGFFANGEISGSDSYYESNSHDEKRSAFTVVNAALGYRIDNWTLTFWGRNLFNTEYEKRVFFFNNGAGETRYQNPADPRQFGATLNYTW
ncbi:MAG: TonB-dependent receptor [Opitutales bacterium]